MLILKELPVKLKINNHQKDQEKPKNMVLPDAN
jgi:hypothetical protein